MKQARPAVIVKYLRKLAAVGKADPTSDRELLQRFAYRQDEAAFTTLVQRHGPMVLRVCRRLLSNWHDAEDVCQAVFLVLASKAASRYWQPSIANWLYQVAYHLALKAKASAASRRPRESRTIFQPQADPAEELSARELQAALHEELARLPEKYRAPLVLCYLEGATRDEAARQLGWPVGTLKSRVERGRDLLHSRLAHRGLTLSAALSTALLTEKVTEAALPAGLTPGIVRAAVGYTTRGLPTAAAGSEPALNLARGLLNVMSLSKFKLAMVWLLGGCLLVGSASLAVLRLAPAENGQMIQDNGWQPPLLIQGKGEPGRISQEGGDRPGHQLPRKLRVLVLDPQGKPLSGAKIHSSIWTEEKGFKANHDHETDATGAAQLELPKSFYILRLWAGMKPFVTMIAGWEQNELASLKEFPAEYSFRLASAVPAGGRVVDEEGKPIAGARVEVTLQKSIKPVNGDGRASYNIWLANGNDAARTDADGRWRIDNVPDDPRIELTLSVSHSDFVSGEYWREVQKRSGITTEVLRQRTATLTLKRGVIVGGRVIDPDGKPIKDALVVHGEGNNPDDCRTDDNGLYRLPALAPEVTTLTVLAPGWAPQLRRINIEAGLPSQEFRMEPGKPIRLRIVDGRGKPLPAASVIPLEWKGSKALENLSYSKVDTRIPRKANEEGIWEWTWAPNDMVKLQIGRKGFANCDLVTGGDASLRTVPLKPEHRLTGRVIDGVTGKPIPSFTVIPIDVFRKDWLHAERGNAVAGKNGRLDYHATRTDIPLRLRIEAPGYRTQDGPEFRVGDDTPRSQDFRLQPSQPIVGVVLDTAGQPVAKCEVLQATPTQPAKLAEDWNNHRAFTDAAGRFSFPDPGEPFALLARTGSAFAMVEFPADQHDTTILQLQKWASITGRFYDGGQPVRGAMILLQPIHLDSLDRPRIYAMLQTHTGPDGSFDFPHVPRGPVSVRVYLGPWKDDGFRSGPSVPLNLKPGERVELDLGHAGVGVKGKVKLTGKVPPDLDCTYSLNYLVRRAPDVSPPDSIANLGFDARKGWRDVWRSSSEGSTYLSTLQHWFVKLAADGTFRISGVPPGEYDLAIAVYAKPTGCLVDPLARTVIPVNVTAADAASGELTLREIAAEVVPIPAVGDTPALGYHRADGTPGTLAECRGRYTVVHFWASWCGPCKQQLPALRGLHEHFAARGLAVLSLSLDEDQAAWQGALKRLGLPWPQGRLAAPSEAGVSSVPAYWLIDPAGKIFTKADDPDQLARLLAERLK
jgi:RNA polymerase sigma factor (sigma-70 family)